MTTKEQQKRFQEQSALIYQSTHERFVKETAKEKQVRLQRLKVDVRYFVEYYLPHYASAESADFQIHLANYVNKHPTCKIIIRWGRGLAKSVWSDVIIPLWLWVQEDINYMVIVGNNLDKAKILLSDLQAEFANNQRLINDFGEQVQHGSWEEGYFRCKNGFTAKALGMGQSPRGLRMQAQRPDYIACDDLEDKDIVRNPMRQDQIVEWIEQDLLPTMDGKRRRYLHPNNNYAPRTIQEELRLRHPDWKVSEVAAYDNVTYQPAWASKYTPEYYKEVEKEVGLLAARAEYNNQPHLAGKIFKPEQIQWVKLPRLDYFKLIVGFWDVAYAGTSTSDYNAVRVWGLWKNNFYYIDSFVVQSKMKAAIEWMAEFEKELPDNVVVHWRFESQFWNGEVQRSISEVEQNYGVRLNLSKSEAPRTKKIDRILSLQPKYQNGRIYYNADKQAHNSTLIGLQQLYGIEPNYRTHDDAPDADEQAIYFLSKYIAPVGGSEVRSGKFRRDNSRRIR